MGILPGLGQHYTGNGYPWDLNPGGIVDTDLSYFKSIGVTWIRTGIMPYSYSKNDVPNGYKDFIAYVKNWGGGYFKVLTGVGASIGFSVYQDWWTGFKNSIPAFAQWAQQLGLEIFCIGNEEATHNYTTYHAGDVINGVTMTPAQVLPSQQVHDDTRGTIALTAKTYFTGTILYTGSAGEMPEFLTNGLGSIDILGHNQYDLQQNFIAKLYATMAAFGNRLWVTEWSTEGGFNAVSTVAGGFGNEQKFASENMRKFRALLALSGALNPQLQTFYFQYGATKSGDALQNSYGLMAGTSFRSSPRIIREELVAAAGHGRIGWCV